MRLSDKHHAALMTAEWFAGLPAVVRDDIVAHGRLRVLKEKERLHSRGDAPDSMYGVLEGCIRCSAVTTNDRVTILDFYGPGLWIGEVAALDKQPRMLDAEAYGGGGAVLQLGIDDLDRLLVAHPAFCEALLRLEVKRLRIVLTAIEQYSTQSLEHRLANRLLMLIASFGVAESKWLKIDLYLPQETLAELIGSTRQRVNQILQAWEARSIVRHEQGRVLVLDRAQIENIAQG